MSKIKKMTSKAQKIFAEAGYDVKDNRDLNWRNLNTAIDFGIQLTVAKVGTYYVSKSGFKWKVEISFKFPNGKISTRRFNSPSFKVQYFKNKDGSDYASPKLPQASTVGAVVCEHLLTFQEEFLKGQKQIFETAEGACKCGRCNGKGEIIAFKHIAKGICFNCMGVGFVFSSKY